MRRTTVVGILLAAAAMIGAACGPPPTPNPVVPKWEATVLQRDDASAGPGYGFTATTDDWWAVVELSEDYLSGTLHLYHRPGSGGAPEAEPSFSFDLEHGALAIAMSDHLVAVRARTPVGDDLPVALFELEDGTWAPAGTVLRPIPGGSTFSMDLTDEHLVLGEQGRLTPPVTDGRVAVLPIDRTGPGVTVGSPTVLDPAPTWSEEARSRFGARVSIVGDLLAASTSWDRLAIYQHGGSGWALLDVLQGGNPFADGHFARTISLDRSGSPRIAVGTAGGWEFAVPQPGRVEIYELVGGTWTVTHTIGARASSALNGLSMGSLVALDGNRLVVSGHWQPVTRPGGDGTIADLRLEVHDLAATPTFREELSVYDAVGGVDAHPTASMVGALDLDLSGEHLAVSAHVSFVEDPAALAAISFDHR